MSRRSIDLDQLAELEEEQRFLLRSLGDLEREHAAGDVDELDYATLRDGYTARAAAVMRAIEDGRAALPAPRRRNPWHVVGMVVVVLAVALGAGMLVARTSGQRLDEGTRQPMGTLDDDDVGGMLVRARQQLTAGDTVGAFALYSAVLQERPDDVEATTYAAWLLALDARGTPAASQRATQGLLLLDRAIAIDPTYPDAHCFAAIIAANFLSPPDLERSRVDGQACLDRNPPTGMRGLLEQFLGRVAPTPAAP